MGSVCGTESDADQDGEEINTEPNFSNLTNHSQEEESTLTKSISRNRSERDSNITTPSKKKKKKKKSIKTAERDGSVRQRGKSSRSSGRQRGKSPRSSPRSTRPKSERNPRSSKNMQNFRKVSRNLGTMRNALRFKPKAPWGKVSLEMKLKLHLNLVISSASDLRAMDTNGKSDPFVEMWLASDDTKKQKTTVKKKTLNPVWNERFDFNGVHLDDTVMFRVWDKDTVSKEKIGDGSISVVSLVNGTIKNKSHCVYVDRDGQSSLHVRCQADSVAAGPEPNAQLWCILTFEDRCYARLFSLQDSIQSVFEGAMSGGLPLYLYCDPLISGLQRSVMKVVPDDTPMDSLVKRDVHNSPQVPQFIVMV